MILKYNIIEIYILKRKVYKLAIADFIWLVLIFNLYKNIKQSMKLSLVYWTTQKLLNLEDYKA